MTTEPAASADERWRALVLVADHLRPLLGDAAPDTAPDERLIAPASHHLVSPALGWCAAGRWPGDPVAGYFGAALELNRLRNESILSGLDLALDRLAAAGIVPVLLKGAAMLAGGLYPDAGARVIRDLDLLVPERDLAQADALLRRAGFRPTADAVVSANHHHLPMLVLQDKGAGVELHRQPLPRRWSRLLSAEDAVDGAEDVTCRGRACRIPSPTAMVTHLVAHSQLVDQGHERKTVPLRDPLDLACVAHRRADAVHWERLSRTFRGAGRSEALAMTCAASDYLFGTATPFAVRSEEAAAWLRAGLRRSASTRKLLHARRRLMEELRGNPAHLWVAFNPFAWRALFKQDWSLW